MKRAIVLVAMIPFGAAAPVIDAQTTAPAPAPAPAAAPAQPRPEEYSDRYGILADKNIFVRNRPPTRRGGNPDRNNGPRRPEEALLLTGIVIQEGRNVAMIENTATRTTERLATGASIAGGRIVKIEIDALEFESGDRKTRVPIGRNLLGDTYRPPANGSNGSANGSSATAPSAGSNGGSNGAAGATPPPSGDDAGLSLEERMKRNRERALGGK